MIYNILPHVETHLDLFYKYKRDNEFFGLSNFHKKKCNLPNLNWVLQRMSNFFKTGITFSNLDKLYYSDIISWQTNIESYCKLVWLTNEYLNSNLKFKNLMGVHYNPEISKWDIHPGGSRQTVFNLFGPNQIEMIAFNTAGIDCNFTKIFENKSELYDYFGNIDDFVVTADHGSLIPHLHFDQEELKLNILEWSKKIVHFWNTTNVVGNIPKWVTDNNSTTKNKTLELRVDDNIESLLRGLVLLPVYDNFSDFGISISTLNTII